MSNAAELTHLFRELKAPAAARALPKLAERARAEEWSYEKFAQALLSTEVSARDAHLIVTSNMPFGAWGEIFGDEITAAAMVDRLVHHAEILSLRGDSYRLKDRDLGRVAPAEN
jgi:DNA replication protein DnaC